MLFFSILINLQGGKYLLLRTPVQQRVISQLVGDNAHAQIPQCRAQFLVASLRRLLTWLAL
jgi:hypothetical protein